MQLRSINGRPPCPQSCSKQAVRQPDLSAISSLVMSSCLRERAYFCCDLRPRYATCALHPNRTQHREPFGLLCEAVR